MQHTKNAQFNIVKIKCEEAQKLCDEYARMWSTGQQRLDTNATWVGALDGLGKLRGCLGYLEQPEYARRFVVAWHSDNTRKGRAAAGELFRFAARTMRNGWLLVGTVVHENEATINFLEHNGVRPVAVIVAGSKEAILHGRHLGHDYGSKSESGSSKLSE